MPAGMHTRGRYIRHREIKLGKAWFYMDATTTYGVALGAPVQGDCSRAEARLVRLLTNSVSYVLWPCLHIAASFLQA